MHVKMAGAVCAAVNCGNYRGNCGGLSFLRFPKDAKRLVTIRVSCFH